MLIKNIFAVCFHNLIQIKYFEKYKLIVIIIDILIQYSNIIILV